MKKGASDQEKSEFLQEAQLMSHFKHEHILQLLGVCLDNDPHFIIMELMEGGDLLTYLRDSRNVSVSFNLNKTLQINLIRIFPFTDFYTVTQSHRTVENVRGCSQRV